MARSRRSRSTPAQLVKCGGYPAGTSRRSRSPGGSPAASRPYLLLRELANAGAAVLLYTSEDKEVQLACDRAIVIFGGRVVAEIPVADADEPTRLRAAYNLRSGEVLPEDVAAEAVLTAGEETTPGPEATG